jgi:hypothetical protein
MMATNYADWINNIGKSSGLADAEDPIVIDAQTRECKIPTNFNKQVGVVGDHKANIITFECDRMVDGHDISTCTAAYIKWENTGAKTSGKYAITDRVIKDTDDTKVVFHWVIESVCTTVAGTLKF